MSKTKYFIMLLAAITVLCGCQVATKQLTVDNGQLTMDSLKKWLEEKGHTGIEICPIEPGIEDCFMDLTQ